MIGTLSNARMPIFIVVGVVAGIFLGFILESRLVGSPTVPTGPLPSVSSPSLAGGSIKMAPRVFNLADPNGRRYLKLGVSLQFTAADLADAEKFEKATGESRAKLNEEFALHIAPQMDLIHDAFTTVVSKKTTNDIITPEGKEKLRSDLKEEVNHRLPEKFRILNVFFTDFVAQ